jgi:hypothetical protein
VIDLALREVVSFGIQDVETTLLQLLFKPILLNGVLLIFVVIKATFRKLEWGQVQCIGIQKFIFPVVEVKVHFDFFVIFWHCLIVLIVLLQFSLEIVSFLDHFFILLQKLISVSVHGLLVVS